MSDMPAGTFQGQPLTFIPAPGKAPTRPTYSLIIPIHEQGFLLSHTPERGYVVPSGRIEALETSLETAIRELDEEAAARVEDPAYLGYFTIQNPKGEQYADLYAARVIELLNPEPGSEAEGRRIVPRDELPAVYAEWNDLLAALFDLATKHHSN